MILVDIFTWCIILVKYTHLNILIVSIDNCLHGQLAKFLDLLISYKLAILITHRLEKLWPVLDSVYQYTFSGLIYKTWRSIFLPGIDQIDRKSSQKNDGFHILHRGFEQAIFLAFRIFTIDKPFKMKQSNKCYTQQFHRRVTFSNILFLIYLGNLKKDTYMI